MAKRHSRSRLRTRAGLVLILGGALLPLGHLLIGQAFTQTSKGEVLLLSIKSTINPATSDYVAKGLKQAATSGSECVILQLDTPGGLDTAMRDMIEAILNSPVPVVAYVAPSGARAASAGAVITFAAHVAAMAPGTNIGAAHPVGLGEGKMDETMLKKVENDAAAFARSLAEQRGRNVDWAVKAVRESASVSAVKAVELHVVDLMAANLEELLASLDGREVKTLWGVKKLELKGKPVVEFNMGWRSRLLDVLGNPNIAYLLMMLGFYGLFFELSNPGVIFPGVFGGICLILGLYALHTLQANYAGILLILLGIIFFIAEIKVTSYGALTLGGIISMILGSLMLFESPESYLRVSWYVVIPTVLVTAAFFVFALSLALKAQLAKPTTGREGLIGLRGRAITTLKPTGKVFVHGEYWNALSDEEIGEGERIEVMEVSDLTLKVRKVSG